jgi:hypothetical protein
MSKKLGKGCKASFERLAILQFKQSSPVFLLKTLFDIEILAKLNKELTKLVKFTLEFFSSQFLC